MLLPVPITFCMKIVLLALTLFGVHVGYCQQAKPPKIQWSAYAEVYFSGPLQRAAPPEKPSFIYNHARNNELNLNLAYVKASYVLPRFRANVGLMAGNYAQNNLSAEPSWARAIWEANVGMKLFKEKQIWIDVGVLPSHIGFESAVSADCWTLTRSLLAENSPYVETGVKIGYTSKNQQWYIAGLYLNGWQKIRSPFSIQRPAFGTQINYKPTGKLTLNYSNFIGVNQQLGIASTRHFHNVYAQYQLNPKWGFIAGVDVGSDKFSATQYGTWHTAAFLVQHKLTPKINIAGRYEYYHDPKQVMIFSGTPNGFSTQGFSSNVDVAVNPQFKMRLEGRLLRQRETLGNQPRNSPSITTNLTFTW